MSGHTPIRTILPRTFQRRRDGLFCHIGSAWELCRPPSTSSLTIRSVAFAERGQRCGSAESAVHPHLCLFWRLGERDKVDSAAAQLHGRSFSAPSGERFHKEPSLPYFPCSPSVTRSVLFPRPAALGVLLRPDGRPSGLGFQRKITPKEQSIFFFGASTERHAFGTWERGTLASLRAGVSRGQSGQIQTGEKQWHSTKTKSH